MTTTWILGAPDPEMAAIEVLLREAGQAVLYAADQTGRRVIPSTAYEAVGVVGDLPSGEIVLVECGGPALDALRVVARCDHHRPGDPGYGRGPEDFLAASSVGQVIVALGAAGRLPAEWPGETREEAARRLGCDPWISTGAALAPGEIWFRPGPKPYWVVGCRADGRYPHARYVWGPGEGVGALRVPDHICLTAAADHCLAAAYAGRCPGVRWSWLGGSGRPELANEGSRLEPVSDSGDPAVYRRRREK
jgi:hypothetical protein